MRGKERERRDKEMRKEEGGNENEEITGRRETLSFLSFLPRCERTLLAGKLLARWLPKPIAHAQ